MAGFFLAGAGARVCAGVLARARLAPAPGAAGAGAAAVLGRRALAGASGPADVADRVCAVVKNFEKVPADKVGAEIDGHRGPLPPRPPTPPPPPGSEARSGGGGRAIAVGRARRSRSGPPAPPRPSVRASLPPPL